MRLFGRRQRTYMLAYLGLERVKEDNVGGPIIAHNGDGSSPLHLPEMSCALIEKLVSRFRNKCKTHRNIKDQEVKFLDSIVNWMKRQALE